MPHAMDDFTIILPAFTDMASCDLKVYDGVDLSWFSLKWRSDVLR